MAGLASPDEIDLISEDAEGNALLSIVHTEPWSRDGAERKRLELKLHTYLRFALDGQMVSKYPSLEGRPVVIELAFDEPPAKQVQDYWDKAARSAEMNGVRLATRRLGDTVWRA
jgi:hypothetical protein